MGRLIDADMLREEVYSWGMNDYEPSDFTDEIDDAPTVEAIPKADYENRLKADMVAMLTELQLEIEEREQYYKDKFLEPSNAVHESAMSGRMFGCGDCKEIIQHKIDKLKEAQNDRKKRYLVLSICAYGKHLMILDLV